MKVLQTDGKIETPALAEKIALLWGAHGDGKKFFLLQGENFREYAEWIFASFATPLTVVPISSSLPKEAVRQYLAQLPSGEVTTKEELQQEGKAPANFRKSLSDLWVVIFTSGSSGFPKGVALTGAQLKASAEAHHSRFPNHTWLLSIPPYHIGGFSILSRAHFSDLPFALSSAKAEEILVRMQAGGVDGISLVPTQLEKLLALVNGSAPIPLKAVLLGGAQAGESLLVRAKDWPIFLTYGMTETASQCATATSPFSPLEPLPQYEFRLRTDGELLVRGPSLANGYFVQGGLQPLPQVDGFFPTGDLGQPISPNSQAEKQLGRFAILGRKSDRIQTGGMKLFPQEIEEKLKNLSSMFSDFGVCAIPDPLWGEAICLAYVANDKAANAEKIEETVRNFLSQVLDKKLLPKHLLPLEKIPRTESGKIQRQELSFMVSALLQKKSERI